MASNKNLCEEVSKSPKKLKIADLNLCNYFDMRIVNEQNNSQNLGSISINQESKIISHVEEEIVGTLLKTNNRQLENSKSISKQQVK